MTVSRASASLVGFRTDPNHRPDPPPDPDAATGTATAEHAGRRKPRSSRAGEDAEVLGIRFSLLSLPQLVHIVSEAAVPDGAGPRVLVTANVDHVAQLHRNRRFRAAYARAWIATADGMPVYGYARLRGVGLPGRVTGADLFAALLPALSPARHRAFFVANSAATADALAGFMARRGFPAGAVAFAVPPFGFERDAGQAAALARRVRAHGATHLFVGVGSPKSELWLDEQREDLGDCYALSVGASLDFFVGLRHRAPRWMRRAGLEWLWRLGSEPRRLARRYLLDSWCFFRAVRRDLTPAVRRAPHPS